MFPNQNILRKGESRVQASNITDLSDLPAVLSVKETAKVLRLSRSQAYEWIRQGVIPHVRLGKSIRVPKAALQAWLLRQTQENNSV